MLSKLSFIISKAASIILNREKRQKNGVEITKNLKKNKKWAQITEMPIRKGLILSNDNKITDDLRSYYKLLEVPRLY